MQNWIRWAGAGLTAIMALAVTGQASAEDVRRYDHATNKWVTVSAERVAALRRRCSPTARFASARSSPLRCAAR